MKKVLIMFFVTLMLPVVAQAYDWENTPRLDKHQSECLKQTFLGVPSQTRCSGQDKRHVIKFNYSDNFTVKNVKGVPSWVFDHKVYMPVANGVVPLIVPADKLIVPVDEGKPGNYVRVSIAVQFFKLDDDDPLLNPALEGDVKAGVMPVAVKGAPPTMVEEMFGKVTIDWVNPDASKPYATLKERRINAVKDIESKVSIFHEPIINAMEASINRVLLDVGMGKTSSFPSHVNTYDSSRVVRGTSTLTVLSDGEGHVGKVVYHFLNVGIKNIIDKFEGIYGPSREFSYSVKNKILGGYYPRHELNTWKKGRITISAVADGKDVDVTYWVAPYCYHLASKFYALSPSNGSSMDAF